MTLGKHGKLQGDRLKHVFCNVASFREACLLFNGHRFSSSCSGVGTAEVALAIIEKTCNASQLFHNTVDWKLISTFEPSLHVFPSMCQTFGI